MRQRIALLVVLFGGLLLVFLAVPPSQQRLPPLTTYSSQPEGGRALRLWLEELHYAPQLVESVPFRLTSSLTTLLVLQPTTWMPEDDLKELERWVRDGGVLIAAGDDLRGTALLRKFGFAPRALTLEVERASPQGRLAALGTIGPVLVRAQDELGELPANAEAFLGDGQRVFGAFLPVGAGRVVALSTPAVFSNSGLRNPDNGRLVFALVGGTASGTTGFDELHHGYGQTARRDFMRLLLDHSWGQAGLYLGLVTLLYLLLRGRRLGRPRPVVVTRGRSLSEYVESLAALYHAGGKRGFATQHFERRLRRDAAAVLGLPGDAADEQLAAAAAALGRDAAPLLRGLRRLADRPAPAEAALVELVGETERQILALRRRSVAEAAPRQSERKGA